MQAGDKRLSETLTATHQQHVQDHQGQREVPERIKQHHRAVMAHLESLQAALQATM